MTRLTWDKQDYENGLDRGVFYPANGLAEPWNGLLSVDETTEDAATGARYIDGMKYNNQKSPGNFSASISAFALPPSFALNYKTGFGISYRILTKDGYRVHLIYNAVTKRPGLKYTQKDATTIGFDISTKPIAIPNLRPSAHLIIDTNVAWPETVAAFEDILYGDDTNDARLPSPSDVSSIFDLNARYKIIDNGDGTYTMDAPDDTFAWIDSSTVDVNWPKPVVFVDEDTYVINSW